MAVAVRPGAAVRGVGFRAAAPSAAVLLSHVAVAFGAAVR